MLKSVILPIAGMGSRDLPATKTIPKEMLPIVDKPAIHYILDEARNSGIEQALFISGRHKRAVEDYFDRFPELEESLKAAGKMELLQSINEPADMIKVFTTRQPFPRGLGDAIYQAKGFVSEDAFAVMLPDDIVLSDIPCLKQLLNAYDKYHSSVIAVEKVDMKDTSSYGIISGTLVDDNIYLLDDLVEKPEPSEAPSNMGIIGRYVLTKEIFAELESAESGVAGEIQLTDALKSLLKRQKVYAVAFDGKRFDVGSIAGLIKANVSMGLQNAEFQQDIKNFLLGIMNEI